MTKRLFFNLTDLLSKASLLVRRQGNAEKIKPLNALIKYASGDSWVDVSEAKYGESVANGIRKRNGRKWRVALSNND